MSDHMRLFQGATAPSSIVSDSSGLFYGGGVAQLGTQLLGLITVDAYVVIVMFIIFKIIDKTIGLRVPAEVEIDGLRKL